MNRLLPCTRETELDTAPPLAWAGDIPDEMDDIPEPEMHEWPPEVAAEADELARDMGYSPAQAFALCRRACEADEELREKED